MTVQPPHGRTRALIVARTSTPPRIDGQLADEAWSRSEIADRFWISEQQRAPSEQTEVLALSDGRFLYFAFRVHDRQPNDIEALQTRENSGLGFDDQIAIELDPYLSHREISTYSVNAIGTRTDAIAGGRARQSAWKGEWQAAAARTSYGWSVEIAIPFAILNFEPGTTTFGVNFLRYHNRTREWSRWADVTVQNLPEEMGRLTGLEPVTESNPRPLTFLPYVVAGRNSPDKRGRTRDSLITGGADIRYEPRQNLTGVLSLNPDFSQVENAITDINFNYVEKFRTDNRPFFQEGTAYFGKSPAYFYSNRIPGFDYGAKLFTRTEGYRFGALATRAPDRRTDAVLRLEREFDPTRSATAMFVGSDTPSSRGLHAIASVQGREPSGVTYAINGATTRLHGFGGTLADQRDQGNGTFARGSLGWQRNYWISGVTVSRYAAGYAPVNALLAQDLPGTRGVNGYASYYREDGAGAFREVTGSLAWHGRDLNDGRLQRSYADASGSVEFRNEVKLSASANGGLYRPTGSMPNTWSPVINRDAYASLGIDLNTRSSRFGYGAAGSWGKLGGQDYRYGYAYAWLRPTATTVINVTGERLRADVAVTQIVTTIGWDITPRYGLYARWIGGGDHQLRLAWRHQLAQWLDFFAVVDRQADRDTKISAKILMTLP